MSGDPAGRVVRAAWRSPTLNTWASFGARTLGVATPAVPAQA